MPDMPRRHVPLKTRAVLVASALLITVGAPMGTARAGSTPNVPRPQTTATNGPHQPGPATTVTLTFESDDPDATFQCQLKKRVRHAPPGVYEPCTSPKTYKHLAVGPYKFKVRAVNQAGYRDLTPAYWKFTVTKPHH